MDRHNHGLINYKDTKVKCRHQKKLTCKGTLRQMFIRVYRLEIESVMLVFSTQLCELFKQLTRKCKTHFQTRRHIGIKYRH